MDLLVHVVRCFGDERCPHPLAILDPVRDVEVVETELLLADLEILGRQRLKVEKRAQAGDKAAAPILPTLVKVEAGLNRGTWARDLNLGPAELKHLEGTPLLTMKPCLFVANLSEAELNGGIHYAALKALAAARHRPVVPILGDLEAGTPGFLPRGAPGISGRFGSYRNRHGSPRPGVLPAVGSGDLLYRRGPRSAGLVCARRHPGPQGRGPVHSDMEKGFIRAEVMPFAALDELGSPARVKEAGLLKVEGRDYLVADGDILLFRFQR